MMFENELQEQEQELNWTDLKCKNSENDVYNMYIATAVCHVMSSNIHLFYCVIQNITCMEHNQVLTKLK